MPTEAPPLTAADGTPLADLLLDDSMGLRWAILTALHAPAAAVAPVVLDGFRGHRVVTEDDDLADLLVAAGGTVTRRGHDYEYDLGAVPPDWAETPAPQGFTLSRDLDHVGLAEAHAAANPPGHPDYEDKDHVEDLRSMIAGEVLGPNVPEATWQVSDDAGPCGAVIVSARPMKGGGTRAWVLDVFVHPRHQGRGLGGVLLRRSVAGAAEASLPVMGLVVSDGNPARAVYEALGFRHLRSGTSIDVP